VKVAVRSEVLTAAATRISAIAEELREDAGRLAAAVAAAGPPRVRSPGEAGLLARWLLIEGRALDVVGPRGMWGESVELDVLAAGLRAAARAYTEVERGVAGVLAGVAAAADLGTRGGWFVDAAPGGGGGAGAGAGVGERRPLVQPVESTLTGPLVARDGVPGRVGGVSDLVAAGEGLDGGRVRVLETTRGDGGSAWVVIVPGTQEWSPRAGANPFDLTTDVRALTGDATLAAAGVAAALAEARVRSGRGTPDDPVLLVGHSQGGILAAALASDPAFRRSNRVTHVVTSGSPVGLFPVPSSTRVLSVEHADDPVPRLDLTPNPAGDSWTTIVAPTRSLPVDVNRHRLGAYVQTVRVAEGAPRGTVGGLDAWQASAGTYLGAPVRSVSEVVVARGVADSPP
jgi:PGAP1-like protein